MMNKSYDVYMCRERKESEIDIGLALEALKKFSASQPRIAAVPPTAWETLANERHWWPTQEYNSEPERDYHAIAVVIFVVIAIFYHFWQ